MPRPPYSALYLHVLLGERVGVDETRVRVVDGCDEAAQRAVVHFRVVYFALFVAVDLIGRERELHLFDDGELLRREGQAPLPVRADGLRDAVKRYAEQRADEYAREQMQYLDFNFFTYLSKKPRYFRYFMGFTASPLTLTSKCRWLPVATPVAPTRPITVWRVTFAFSLVSIFDIWA